jgi:hypothetical protein
LRSAIEPFVAKRTFSDFISWLIAHYAEEAIAFVRFFLTPDNILMLRLAPNYTAALSLRVRGLETCVRHFNFGPLIDEDRFRLEAKALNTALLLTNIQLGQFEVPWETFKSDITEKEKDNFEAYVSLTGTANALPLLGKAVVAAPHRFPNGKVVNYQFENNLWPLVYLLLCIIDDFIDHPSIGLEAMLSTRFRHDTMMREYIRVISDAREANIPGVTSAAQRSVIDRIVPHIISALESWLGRRMHTLRPNRPEALFDLTPSQDELWALAQQCEDEREFEVIAQSASSWLHERLDSQVAGARHSFESELVPALNSAVTQSKDTIIASNQFRFSDVTQCAALITTVVTRVTTELGGWFRSGNAMDRPPLTFRDMKLAADGVFETQIASGALRTDLHGTCEPARTVSADKVRLCFDLLSEIFANALKHGQVGRALVRIWPFENSGLAGFVFSTCAASPMQRSWVVRGERYLSLNDSIFREGNSGLSKIAALAASLVGENIELKIMQRKRFFHVRVPLWRLSDS